MTGERLTSFAQLLMICVCIGLSGCTTPQVAEPTPPSSTSNSDEIRFLLDEARAAFESDRLTTPRSESAFRYYLDVLVLDPGNTDARAGIAAIADQYLSWAIDHARNGNIQRARYFLGLAQGVDATHPNLGPVSKLINDSEELRRERHSLSDLTVSDRNGRDPLLDTIAGRIVATRAFITIRAPSDAAGRWIYQQLNQRVSFRVEARFMIGRPSQIELIIEE